MRNIQNIHDEKLLGAIAFIFVSCSILDFLYKSKLFKPILMAIIRSVLQLYLLGMAVFYVFGLELKFIWLTIVLMISVAGLKNVSLQNIERFKLNYCSIFFSVIPMSLLTLYVIGGDSFRNPTMVLPITGLLIGNCLNGIILGIDRFEQEIKLHRELFISDLSLGLSPKYAAKKYTQLALKAAMTPIINSMSIVGIVSIPGMMTGQILAGVNPVSASKYQLLILISIMGTVFIGSVIGLVYSLKRLTRNNRIYISGDLRNV